MKYNIDEIRREPSPYADVNPSYGDRMLELEKIADEFGFDVVFNDKDEEPNSAHASGNIVLGVFTDIDNMTIAFFHELCHLNAYGLLCGKINSEGKYILSSQLAHEGFIWEHAFFMAAEYGYKWPINHSVYDYAYTSLFTYVFNDIDDCFRNKIEMADVKKDIKNWKFRKVMQKIDSEYNARKKKVLSKYNKLDISIPTSKLPDSSDKGELKPKVIELDENGVPVNTESERNEVK